jgi:allophanate hydrolase subunit 2
MIRVRGLHFVVGGARPGRMHEGVAPGGAFVPELLAAANAAAGRAWDDPAVEFWGPLAVSGAGTVFTADGALPVDGEMTLRPQHRVGYVALESGGPPTLKAPFTADGAIRIVLGPDRVALAGRYHVGPVGNRVGIRLVGPPAAAPPRGPSAPMVRGALQAPPSGELIVLGPDHPTTGGYPVVAAVCVVDLGRLFARTPGAAVDFVAISVEEARRLRRTAPAPSR